MSKKIGALLLVCMLFLAACSVDTSDGSGMSVTTIGGHWQLPEGWGGGEPITTGTTSTPETADLSGMDFTFSDRDLSSESDGAKTLAFANEDLLITVAGTYRLSGTLTDHMIRIAVGDNDKVQLVFAGVTVQNDHGPAVYVQSGDKVFITLEEGSVNRLSDGASYELTDGDSNVDAALFSRADLTINGGGSLTVTGNCKHAVVSKDDLVISSGTLTVTAKNVGLNGKDCVKLGAADITVTAGSDGIRSDNTEDTSRGYVYVDGTKLTIAADNDAIQAEMVVNCVDATINLTAGGGSDRALSYSSESYKGIKAGSDVLISGGSYTVDSADDCVHSNNTVTVTGGTLQLSSGDDGIHADNDLAISGGAIKIFKSYEGLESSRILISGGTIDVTASDDGLNAAGGNDASALGDRPGMGRFSASTGTIEIAGGYLLVDASGDGIDSNGTLTVSGGITLVSGPTNGGNGSLDYQSAATVTGGVLIALGSNGMAQNFSAAENQGAMLCSFGTQAAGTSFAVCDVDGKVVASFTPAKAYQSAVVTTPDIQSGNTYMLVVGGMVSGADVNGYARNITVSGGTTLTTVSMTSSLYGSGNGFGGPGGFGPGDRPGRW
ncbi:MAG: carbohydrate-binding domain-containing protein [Clostridia bacterium]|nr:carbohydrate-binding domain-containing protein [Clostridia bacterium]